MQAVGTTIESLEGIIITIQDIVALLQNHLHHLVAPLPLTQQQLQQHEIEFIGQLNNEELVAYERLRSTPANNPPKLALNQRLLSSVLSPDNALTLSNLYQEAIECEKQRCLLNPKLKAYNERLVRHRQNVRLGVELTLQQIQQSQQQSQWYYLQSQQYWQNYYNQQYK